MISKRTFFRRVATVVACVALAPEIAFRARLKVTEEVQQPITLYWLESNCIFQVNAAAYDEWRDKVLQNCEWREWFKV